MPNFKRAGLMKSLSMKKKDFESMLAELDIKKTGTDLEDEEFEAFMQTLTLANQIENLADYLEGRATLVPERAEAPKAEKKPEESKAEENKPEAPKAEEKKPEEKDDDEFVLELEDVEDEIEENKKAEETNQDQ